MDQCSDLMVLPGEPPIRYLDRGRGPHTVVLLHSLGADHRLWAPQSGPLAAEHRVLAPDSRGHGGSGWVPGLTRSHWAEDLARLLDHAGAAQVSLAGVSMGGVQALGFALAHPDRVAALVLADTFAELDPPAAQAKIETMTRAAGELGMCRYAGRYIAETFTTEPPPAEARFVRDALAGMRPGAYAESVRACFSARLAGRLAEVRAPTLVLWGERDAKTPRPLAERLAAGIPGARLEVVPEAGHLANLENPGYFLEAVRAHLASVPAQ